MVESVDKEKCIGCGLCQEICPKDVFRLDLEARRAVIRYREDCQTCYQCEMECPTGAIYVDPYYRNKIQVW